MSAMRQNGTRREFEGDLSHRDGLVRFRLAGRDLAVATVERDNESLRAELTMEGLQRSS